MQINKKLCQDYLNQLEVIRILFFLVRFKGQHIDIMQKRKLKKKLKGAQRYLENLKGNRTVTNIGDLVAFNHVVKYWQDLEKSVISIEEEIKNSKTCQDSSPIL